jgi:hypothetical protein
MGFHADLSPWPSPLEPAPLAVGFLASDKDYEKGEVATGFFARLVTLLEDPWQPFVAAGRQSCPFCRFTGGPGQIHFGAHLVELGRNLLFVPGERAIYVAPSLVAHYVDAHYYRPPEEFQKAVTECQQMGSAAYLRRLRALGAKIQTRRE